MATSRRNTSRKGITLYNKILKEFTKVNKTLPLDRQLSLPERRKYIKEVLYPQYRGTAPSRVPARAIKVSVLQVLDTIAPKEECDVNYISPSVYADIGFFELDDYISSVLPNCIFIRIDAKQYGTTRIFNTLNYNYTRSGVKAIVDNVREFVDNNSGVDISLTGVKKLKKGKANDGTPENYFIDFILTIESEPQDSIEPVDYEVPRGERKVVRSVRSAINERLKQLELKKKRKKNARKTAKNNLQKVKNIGKRQKAATRRETKEKLAKEKYKISMKSLKQLDTAFNKGLLTPEQYQRFKDEIVYRLTQERKRGGQV